MYPSVRRSLGWLCALVLGVTLALAPAVPARAVTGDLTFLGCVANPSGAAGCTPTPVAGGLTQPIGLAVSPDGSSVYTSIGQGVAHLQRGGDGRLVFAGCVANAGAGGCADPDLDTVTGGVAVAVSPDGASVYVASSSGLTAFNRAPGGALTFASCVGITAGCSPAPSGVLAAPSGVTVSSDGTWVYLTTASNDGVVWLQRLPGGAVTYSGCITGVPTASCTSVLAGALDGASGVSATRDGSVYVAARNSGAVTRLARAPSGALTFGSCIAAAVAGCTDPGSTALSGATGLAVSPDETSIYVAAAVGASVVSLTRGAGGALTWNGCVADNGGGGCANPEMDALGGASGVAVSPDGLSVYVTTNGDSSITHLTRAAGGALTFASCIADAGGAGCADPAVDSLGGAFGVAVSPSGGAVYAASFSANAVTTFTRSLPTVADRTAPETTIGKGPKKRTKKKKATFTFTADEAATFQCQVDKKPFAACQSGVKVKVKKRGKHTFSVRAVDAAGNVDATPAVFKWKVVKKKKD